MCIFSEAQSSIKYQRVDCTYFILL